MNPSPRRVRDPRSDEEILRDLALGLAALLERVGEDFGTVSAETNEWLAQERVILGVHDVHGRAGVVFHSVERVPAHISVLAASQIHGCRTILEHIKKAKRRTGAVIPGQDNAVLRKLIEKLDDSSKHELLPVLMLASSEPKVDLIRRSTDKVIRTVAIEMHEKIAVEGDQFILTEPIPDYDISVHDLGFEFQPLFAVRYPGDDSQFIMLGEFLVAARDWTLQYAMPFFDWLADQPTRVEPTRAGEMADQYGTYKIATPGGSRPKG